ncbi:MAG: diguanylate cyclase [Nitrospirota bacterium]
MAGVNVDGDLLRESPKWVAETLAPTPIRWLRIHTLPTRSLDQKGPGGLSYLDAIDHVCRSGLNILTPIDVGYTEVVGSVPRAGLDAFIEESYGYSSKAARLIAERLRRSIEKNTFMKSDNLSLKLTASFGIASYPAHAATKEELIRLADEAMYRVKYHTRNSVYVVGE